jgi:hypothetical protein
MPADGIWDLVRRLRVDCKQLQQSHLWEYRRADSTSVVVKQLRIINVSMQMNLKILNISEIQDKGKDTLARPWVFQEAEAPRISRQSAHEFGKVASSKHRPPLPPRKYSCYSFLLEAESNTGP